MTASPTPLSPFFAQHGADFIEIYDVQVPLRCGAAGLEYQAAREKTLICDGGQRAWLDVRGTDVCDFFQRTLSSDVDKLAVGEHQLSAMLDGKGRWIAELILYRFEDAADGGWQLGVDLPVECCETFLQKLEMMHFGEDISFTRREFARVRILGNLPDIQHNGRCIVRPDAGTTCHEILLDSAEGPALLEQLVSAGHQLGGWVAQDILRVEGGFPLWGSDFDGNYTLPGSNEWRRASITKGCYAGQEVVARINTYGQAPRQLVQVHFDGQPQFMQGATLQDAEGKEVGNVSSWVFSPQHDKPIAFAYIKRSAAHSGTTLSATLQQASANCKVLMPEKIFG
ncbi:MAG: aminomethyltransferase [Myxococcota bacterium]|jgi:aminomethyltransferase